MMTDVVAAPEITLPVRPGETVRFPPLCVSCGQPAGENLTIRRRQGQTVYRLDVPICAECARWLQRRSAREESLVRIGWLAAAVAALMGFTLVWLITGDMALWGRLAASLIAAALAAGLAYWSFRRAAQAAELPEKRAVSQSAQITSFSWRDVTLMLASAALADQVVQLNKPLPPVEDGAVIDVNE
jgi:hypothetical protein